MKPTFLLLQASEGSAPGITGPFTSFVGEDRDSSNRDGTSQQSKGPVIWGSMSDSFVGKAFEHILT